LFINIIEVAELKQHFDSFDRDGNGHIETHELAAVMKSLGENPTDAQLKALIAEVDVDNNHTIEFNEFVTVKCNVKFF
jgi:calmodulin